jgi:hypothetical protein
LLPGQETVDTAGEFVEVEVDGGKDDGGKVDEDVDVGANDADEDDADCSLAPQTPVLEKRSPRAYFK